MAVCLKILFVAFVIAWATPCFGEPENETLSATAYFIEQSYLSPDPDFSIFKEPPPSALSLVEDPKSNFHWLYSTDSLKRLVARHPDLPAKLEAGAAYRKEVYDGILEQFPKDLKKNGIPFNFSQTILKSYLAELAAYRMSEKKRDRLEAETQAYEKIRSDNRYRLGSSVNSWAKEHQKKHGALVEKLIDEKVRQRNVDDFLPPEKFLAWFKRTEADLTRWRPNWRFGRLRDQRDVHGNQLPFGYAQEADRDRDFHLANAHHRVGVANVDPTGQRALQRWLQENSVIELDSFESTKQRYLGTGNYGTKEADTDKQRPFTWLRDLDWWSKREIDNGDQVEKKRRELIENKITARREARQKEKNQIYSAHRDNLIDPDNSALYPGLQSKHIAQNWPSGVEGKSEGRILFKGSKFVPGPYGGWADALPDDAPEEFLWGRKEDWNPATAKIHQGFSERADFLLESSAQFFPSQGMVSLPLPEGHNVNLSVYQRGRYLDPKEYSVLETPEGFLFAQIKSGSNDPVRLTIGYQKTSSARLSFSRDANALPVLTANELIKMKSVLSELESMGERHLSSALGNLLAEGKPINVADISAAIKGQSLYSYLSAQREPEGLESITSFRPFLNPEGKFCLQCSGAADLLELILNKVLIDHPTWKVRTSRVLLRESDSWLIWETAVHRWVGLQNGQTHIALDPTPRDSDPRNPTVSFSNIPVSQRAPTPKKEKTAHPPLPAAVESSRQIKSGGDWKKELAERLATSSLTFRDFFAGGETKVHENESEGREEGSGGKFGVQKSGELGGTGGGSGQGRGGSQPEHQLLSSNWREPFARMRKWGALTAERVRELVTRFPQKRPAASLAPPEELATGPETVQEEEPPTEVAQIEEPKKEKEKEKTEVIPPAPSKHPAGRLAQEPFEDAAKKAILAELQTRQVRNSQRRANLKRMEQLEELLLMQLEIVYERPLGGKIKLPHHHAIAAHKKVRSFVEGKKDSPSPEALQSLITSSKAEVDLLVDHFQQPGPPRRFDSVRDRYLAPNVTHPASKLVTELSAISWSPLESEDIDDIMKNLYPQTVHQSCTVLMGRLPVGE